LIKGEVQLANTDKALAARTGPVPIPTDRPRGFVAERIIVRELYRDQHDIPRYRLIDRRKKFVRYSHFYRLVAQVAGHDDSWRGSLDAEEPEGHVLNIPVYLPSYIVLKINENLGPFSWPGIELTSPNDAYGELRYVTRDGVVSADWPDEECWAIYFAALLRTGTVQGPYRQGLNYWPAKRKLHDPIDPDIRYPGNGGQIDEP
jgi:hypothetical protein